MTNFQKSLAISFRILEPFDFKNTSFLHEMDLFFIYPNCIHKISYFSPLCTVYNIAWRVYSIHTHPLESGAEKTDQSSTTSTLGPLIKNLTYIFFREKKNLHTHHAIIHHFRIFTCFVNFFADLFIMLYY